MIFDTDVLIWGLRGNLKAARAIDEAQARSISVVTYMELLQGARDKREVKSIRAFLSEMRFQVLPLSENIGHRAAIYMEEYGLAVALGLGDALIAATSAETSEQLLTANDKHYNVIKELDLKVFRP